MSNKNDDQVEAAAPAAAGDAVTLDEFCARLSMTDKRVELIGAFHYVEKAAGRIKDAESAFNGRYAAFATKPV